MTLELYTSTVRTRDPDRFVIVRAGAAKDPAGFPFAPSGPLLKRALGRRAHEDEDVFWSWYVDAYTEEMRRSYVEQRAAWDALLRRWRIVACCYCPPDERSPSDTHCHRTRFAEILVKVGKARGITVVDGGEIP